MIYTSSKSKTKAKKKPGWQEAAKQEAEWLARINAMSLSSKSYGGTKKVHKAKPKTLIVNSDAPTVVRVDKNNELKIQSKVQFVPHDNSKVAAEVLYKDNPEMLAREKEARERKFATAPAYNKSGDVYITPEMMKDITAGLTRRR